MKHIGNRIIFDSKGNIIFQYGQMETSVIDYERKELGKLDYVDLEYGLINYDTHYIESIDINTKQPVIKEFPKQDLTPEQALIKELEERLAHAESQLISTIPELHE